MVLPEEGAFNAGDPVSLEFSEAIDPATFEVRVWQTQLDEELEIPEDAEPVIASCKLSDGCEGLTFAAVEGDGGTMGVELTFDPEGIGRPGARSRLTLSSRSPSLV